MRWVYRFFVFGLWSCPLFLIRDDVFVRGGLTIYAAILLVLTAILIRPGEARFLWATAKPIAFAALALGAWILIQLAPNPADWLRSPDSLTWMGRSPSITMSPV